MKKIAVATDSNSGITQAESAEIGIFVLPMPFMIDGKDYLEDINLTQDEFYEALKNDCKIATSQPAVADVMDFWNKILESYDQIIYIPMSSGLSGSLETALMLAKEEYEGRVFVIDNQRISVTQRQSAIDARDLVAKGFTAEQIADIMMRDKKESSIYIMVDTLKYLKRGGRVTPAAAAIGTVLGIKPVLQIQGEKLDAYAKVRGVHQAYKVLLDAIDKDTKRYPAEQMNIHIAHTQNIEIAEKLRAELLERYPNREINIDALSLSVSCHIGPGAIAVAWEIKTPELL